MAANPSTKVFLVCSGLGHIKRGFESFTQECFTALSGEPALDITLFKGGGKSAPGEVALWNTPREKGIAQFLHKITRKNPHKIEQVSFTLSLLPFLRRGKPDVVYFSDGVVGDILWRLRGVVCADLKLLFSNGGPTAPPFPRWDHVQQVTSMRFRDDLAAGDPVEKFTLLPYGFQITPVLERVSVSEKRALRAKLDLPTDRPIVLSVGAINCHHKRMDYLVQEIAALPPPRPYLLLLGQAEPETPQVVRVADDLLGAGEYAIRAVPLSAVPDYYRAADVFALASLVEGFGRVYVEALSRGLPCLAHDSEVTREIVKDGAQLSDLSVPGGMTRLLQRYLAQPQSEQDHAARHRSVYECFSWDRLRPQYVAMIQKCARGNLQ